MAASASASASASAVFLLFMARILGFTVALLVLLWASAFSSSFLPSSLSHKHHLLYSVLPSLSLNSLLLCFFISEKKNLNLLSLICLSAASSSSAHGNWLHSHQRRRWFPGSRGLKKCVHLWLQGLAMTCGFFGIWTKFQGKDGIVANFYSLHSWMGLLCISLFAAQWLIGFWNFWHRGEVRKVRNRILPWHVFLGLYTYGLAVATAETGLAEKLIFLQQAATTNLSKHSAESIVVNSLGLVLALLSVLVVFAALSPIKNQQLQQSLQTRLSFSDSSTIKKGLLVLVFF